MSTFAAPHPLSQVIYEGVLESPPWTSLLSRLEQYMQATSATLVLRRPHSDDDGLTIYLYSDSDQAALDDFRERGHHDSPFAELPEQQVFTLRDRVSESELSNLTFTQYLRDYNVGDLIGFDVTDKKSRMRLRLRLIRLSGEAGFSPSDRTRLQSIVALMHKALQLYAAYTQNNFVEAFYDHLLGSMDIATIIVNQHLEVFSTNTQAQYLLATGKVAFLRGKQLQLWEKSEQPKLRESCHRAIERQAEISPEISTRHTISDRDGANWEVNVRGLSLPNVAFNSGEPQIAVLLQPLQRNIAPSPERLVELLAVTPSEAKLVAKLVEGGTLTAAATALGISRNTARAQLSSVFNKTGVNRQSQLVKLVVNGLSTLRQ